MGKIVISENVTLDGVIQDPAGDEGFRHGGWFGLIRDRPRLNKLALDEALDTQALLLGRRSYEWFAARWPSRSGELADRLNSVPKYVVSTTLEHPGWNNSTVLKGDVLTEVSKLKRELNGDIVVLASFQLVRTLMEHDLVDELRLKIFPVVLGAGERLFGETSDKRPVRLVDTQTLEGDVTFLTYEVLRAAGSGPAPPGARDRHPVRRRSDRRASPQRGSARGCPPAPVSPERCPGAHPGRAASGPARRRGSHQPGGGTGPLHYHENCQGPPGQCLRQAPSYLSGRAGRGAYWRRLESASLS